MSRPTGAKNLPTLASITKKVITESLKDFNNDMEGMTVTERLDNLERLSVLDKELNDKKGLV